MRKTCIILAGVVFSLILVFGSVESSYSEYMSPKKQIESGVFPEDVICKEDRVLAVRDNGNSACITENTAERLNWKIIKTVFLLDDKIQENEIKAQDVLIDLPEIKETKIIATDVNDTVNKNYDELNFAISSDVEFSGESYGYYEPTVLRRPAPREMSINFGADHYDIPQMLQNNALALAQGDTTPRALLTNTVTSFSEHDNAIDYRKYVPTVIPDGFELKWIDISQPGVFGDEIGRMDLRYYPNTVSVSGDTMTHEIADIAGYQIRIKTFTYKEVPVSQSYMDLADDTKVFYEEKYGGIYETIAESPSNPNSKGVKLFTNTYELSVGGKGLPLETYEEIFLDIFERQ